MTKLNVKMKIKNSDKDKKLMELNLLWRMQYL